jgi:DmsE family decaheme c-type cytochrome
MRIPKSFLLGASVGLLVVAFIPTLALAKGKAEEGCASETCHPNVYSKGPVVHGPVKAKQCTVCHKPKRKGISGKHPANSFTVDRSSRPCFACHKKVTKSLRQGGVHKPLRNKSCLSCHQAHSGKQKSLLKAATPAELCFKCHKASKFKMKNVHGPVAAGACTFCHSPHAAKNKPLLKMSGNTLCFACHDAGRFKTKFKHKAIEKGCSTCHFAHGSDHKYFVKKKTNDLCATCHQKILKEAKTAKVKHKAIEKAGCGGCHDPHGSQYAKLMKDHPIRVCTDCHDRVITGKHKHGPLSEGDCGACHRPHGGPHPKLLGESFPDEFYGRFSEKRYALCFECHESDITHDKHTTTLTKFRHGNLNLHYLHVVSPGEKKHKGRSCKACHEVHAGPQPKQIRKDVPFGSGGWRLPVTFTKKRNGGRCVVGCHVPQSYNRNAKPGEPTRDKKTGGR